MEYNLNINLIDDGTLAKLIVDYGSGIIAVQNIYPIVVKHYV